jgi:hypothetical protein
MRIINVVVSTEEVEELGRRLAERGACETANRLVRAERQGASAIALADVDQKRLLEALTPGPEGRFEELRRALVNVRLWRAALDSSREMSGKAA